VEQKPRTGEATWDCVFEELFLTHYGPLVTTVGRVIGDRGLAEDLAAEAFYRLYKRGPDREEFRNYPGWVYRVALNLALDSLRANARRLRRETEAERGARLSGKSADALDDLLAGEERTRVRCVLARLKPAQAQILVLGSGGMPYREIAVMLGLKADSIYTLVCRARSRFEQEYLKLYGRRP
jgi:RNA polymerase sigma factor (sigma-70 family)